MANSLDIQLSAFATRIAQEIAMLHLRSGILANLSTEDKHSLVGAINELVKEAETIKEIITTDEESVKSTTDGLQEALDKLTEDLQNLRDEVKDMKSPIDDTMTSSSTTYSSEKIEQIIKDAVAAVSTDVGDLQDYAALFEEVLNS